MGKKTLKKCPLCGGTVTRSARPANYPVTKLLTYIRCDNCGLELSRFCRKEDVEFAMSELIGKWNTRVAEN